ncbi:hypothetical protein QN226_21780, partial [Sinorhizobium sp. 6-117]|nr:hypothetical protein [Sinorhizobium sp. 6-117]
MRLRPPEKLCLAIVAAIAVIDACLIATGRLTIDMTGYAFTVGVGLMMVAVGQFYRTVRKDERLALAATASGAFVLFTNVASILNYLLLPVKFPLIDAALAAGTKNTRDRAMNQTERQARSIRTDGKAMRPRA